jgi:ATP synthase protein I
MGKRRIILPQAPSHRPGRASWPVSTTEGLQVTDRGDKPEDREGRKPGRLFGKGVDYKGMSGAGMASTVGIMVVVATVLGYLFGKWLDKLLGTEPVFLAIFVLLGAGAGLYEVYRVVDRMSKDDPK